MSHTASADGRFDVLAAARPTRQVINRIGDRWSLASVPPRVEYSLTPLGHSLAGRVAAIREWAYDNMATIEGARRDFDVRVGG